MGRKASKSGGQSLLFEDTDEPAVTGAYGQKVIETDPQKIAELPSLWDHPSPLSPAAIMGSREKAELVASIREAEEQVVQDEPAQELIQALEQAPGMKSPEPPKLDRPADPAPTLASDDGFPRKPLDPALKGFLEREQAAHRSAGEAWGYNGELLRAMARAAALIRAGSPQSAAAVLDIARQDVEGNRGVRVIEADIVAAGRVHTGDTDSPRSVLLQFATDGEFRGWLEGRGPLSAFWAHERRGDERGMG